MKKTTLILLAALLSFTLSGVLTYREAQHEAEEMMDGHLAQSARLLLALVRDNESHLSDLATRLATVRSDQRNLYEPPLEFQIGRADGSLLLRSERAPRASLRRRWRVCATTSRTTSKAPSPMEHPMTLWER